MTPPSGNGSILTKPGNSGRSGALCTHGTSPNRRCASLLSVEQRGHDKPSQAPARSSPAG